MIPLLLSGISLAAGTAMDAIGKANEASAEAEAARFRAEEYERQAKVSERNSAFTLFQADREERTERFRNTQVLGAIRAAYGASGITMEGTATDYLEMTRAIAKDNELAIRFRGVIQARAYRDEADSYRRSAANLRKSGRLAAAAGDLKVAGSVLGGVASLAKEFS